jgi:two-component system chemotaxis response regulator CheY
MIPSLNQISVPTPFRVLIIEDSATVRTFLKYWLANSFPSVEILEAEDGKAAFHALGRNSVHLIISDLNMPGMDGFTFLEKLRANSVLKRKPVMVLSGNITPEMEQAAQMDPLLAVVSKPAGIETLDLTLRGLLARANSNLAVAA